MLLKLIASSGDRALAIRYHLVPIVRERGRLEVQRCATRLTTWETDAWVSHRWTPFNDLSPVEASSPGHRHALGCMA